MPFTTKDWVSLGSWLKYEVRMLMRGLGGVFHHVLPAPLRWHFTRVSDGQ
jgi:hypothetical protein